MSRRRKPTRPYRSIASQMSSEHHEAFAASQAAELRGDWAAALRHYRRVPMFRDSTYGEQLEVLAALGDDAPGWLVARWLTVTARRHGVDQRRSKVAFEAGMALAHPHGVDLEALDLTYPEQATSQLWGRDWMMRQLEVYELGGLRDLLLPVPPPVGLAPELVERGGPVTRWGRAAMGGYRIGGLDDEVRTLHDARSGAPREILDLGLGEQVDEGTHVLGRLVPVDDEPGLVLEGPPLVVDEPTAAAVAGRPPGWAEIVGTRIASRRLPLGCTLQPDASLTSDLPHRSWVSLLGLPMGERPDQRPDTLVGQAVAAALRMARDRPERVSAHRHRIGELMIDPLLDHERLARFATPQHLLAWDHLADAVPALARARCQEMVVWCDAAGEATG
ncbi:hypothetical protein JOE61_001416 [Nocardioides salarius]|uniref:Uncharacterized protein n=1 Tax=Nocardioides salarius TaxID=374513 RepID=A0ABS2M8X4_9ACTN|nr:hypothetical protein [Nocardioides salarius]MBM7507602.1 hypothetical protein [Nocardioides salarius]